MKIPQIKKLTEKLLWACLILIVLYLAFTAAYAHLSADLLRHTVVLEMLHSAFLAIVIAIGGGIILDFEIQLSENKNKD